MAGAASRIDPTEGFARQGNQLRPAPMGPIDGLYQ
jgi:hypothetical protein